MFGLMTVAEHERQRAHLQTLHADLLDAGNGRFCVLERCPGCRSVDPAGRRWAVVPSVHPTEADRDFWRTHAMKLADQLADIFARQAPPIPGPEESAVGSIDDGDAEWTPTAIRDRAKRAD